MPLFCFTEIIYDSSRGNFAICPCGKYYMWQRCKLLFYLTMYMSIRRITGKDQIKISGSNLEFSNHPQAKGCADEKKY